MLPAYPTNWSSAMTHASVSDRPSAINPNPVSSLPIQTLFDDLSQCLYEVSAMIVIISNQDFSDYPDEVLHTYFELMLKRLETARSTHKLLDRIVCSQEQQL
jgi:hypothetical protein